MASANSEAKPAQAKREKISKAQQWMMLEVLGASLVLGVCLVLSIFMIKYIKFNTTIIGEKNKAITQYDQTLRNVGVCVDTDKNGRLNDQELENCKANEVSLDEIPGSLRANVLSVMAENEDLETMVRQRNENCYDATGERIDFQKLYEASTDESERQQYLQQLKICSALRAIPDALPALKNTEALMASLDQIFILTGWQPERLTPRDDVLQSEIEGVGIIPVSINFEGSDAMVLAVLNNIEKSIREFDITSATIEWTTSGLGVSASANAFFLEENPVIEQEKTLYASDKARKKTGSSSRVDSALDAKDNLTEGN